MNVDIAKTIAALPGTAVLIGLLIAAALLVILVVLVVKPNGLFGRVAVRRV